MNTDIKNVIIFASNNKGKAKELYKCLREFNIILLSEIKELDNFIIEESENTFEANALKKAEAISKVTDTAVIADDSGLCIDAFDGWPGVTTKRWLEGTDRERNLAILEKMKGLSYKQRGCSYVSSVVLKKDDKTILKSTCELRGHIAYDVRGKKGFGFDEIFVLPNGKTLAELEFSEKQAVNPRTKALQNIRYQVTLWNYPLRILGYRHSAKQQAIEKINARVEEYNNNKL
ncbi:MAG: non-canonical purine NTP pyrophosphatase [Clostridia bacterium]|nr:non-canonical purine NTP pyrophosphatase [Clostridia bacterium]